MVLSGPLAGGKFKPLPLPFLPLGAGRCFSVQLDVEAGAAEDDLMPLMSGRSLLVKCLVAGMYPARKFRFRG